MKYLDYYPPVRQKIREYKIISDVMDNAFERLKNNIENVNDENFILTAKDEGLKKWEKTFGINTNNEKDLELRRFEILANLLRKKSYLIDILDTLVGKEDYKINFDCSNVLLEVKLNLNKSEFLNIVKDLLEDFVPLNVELKVDMNKNRHIDLEGLTHKNLSSYRHSEIMQFFFEKEWL